MKGENTGKAGYTKYLPWEPHWLAGFLLKAFQTTTAKKMTGGTPEVRSDKSLTLLTFDI